jgi:HAD superfamily hydrolase (TIGR01509 family)
MKALAFDCDGVLVDTERDGHRVAFNRAFQEKHLPVYWDVPLYGRLLKVSGGKERLRHYFDQHGWPEGVSDKEALIKDLHLLKTELFMQIIERGELPLRSGIRRIVDDALAAGIRLAVCSTSHERAVNRVVEILLGPERKSRFSSILAGDIVPRKKPAPDIYNLAKQRLGLSGDDCLVVEDSRNGLLAAKAAGMPCLITTNRYTVEEDFSEADRVVPELGDPPGYVVTLEELRQLAARGRQSGE